MKIRTLFLDIGGVLLTNGWDRQARKLAVERFHLNEEEVNERHHLTFDTYESGKLTLNEYLDRIVFYEPRDFSRAEFRDFMFEQSQAFQDIIDFFKAIKQKYQLKVVAVNNEGKELNDHRVKQFRLHELFDGFVSSCFVHLRKPDADIFLMAADISQTPPSEALYIDDRLMFVEVANSLGFHGHRHTNLTETKEFMRSHGFSL